MRNCFLFFIAAVFSCAAIAQAPPANVPLFPGFPPTSHWRNNPADWTVKDGVLTIKSAEKTDWYVAPTNGEDAEKSPILLFPGPKDFWFSARVTVDFKSRFDAGVLALYANDKNWVKFAFEMSNEMKPSIVTVVTRGLSDDCKGAAIEGNSVYLGPEQDLQFGFSSQSPTGGGLTATFSDIHYKPERLRDWSGD